MKQKPEKKYYVITSRVPQYPLERFVSGPWPSKREVRRYLRAASIFLGDKEIVKVVM